LTGIGALTGIVAVTFCCYFGESSEIQHIYIYIYNISIIIVIIIVVIIQGLIYIWEHISMFGIYDLALQVMALCLLLAVMLLIVLKQ
jgi:hypothetical protein